LIFFDALRVKIRDEGLVRNKAAHIAVGVRADGTKLWLRVMNELKNRGIEDELIAVVDGLKGFPEAITEVFAQATRSDLHRSSAAPQPGLCFLEGPQAGGGRAQGHLPGC
jgi:transposase-like protein